MSVLCKLSRVLERRCVESNMGDEEEQEEEERSSEHGRGMWRGQRINYSTGHTEDQGWL